jgi:3-oxoacyl-[acyl-carrier-protein] synthase III
VGSAKLVLLVTAEGLLPNITNILDWKTSSLMGEGATAFLVERGDEETYVIYDYNANQGPALYNQMPLRKDVIAMAEVEMNMRQLFQEGKGSEVNMILSQYLYGYMKMNGKEVFRKALRAVAESIDVLCRHAKLSPDELVHNAVLNPA